MKQLIFSVFLALLSTLAYSQKETAVNDFKKLSWLQGNWKRTNTKPGRSGFESWEKVSVNEYKGLGVSMQGKDTTFQENLQLVIKDGHIYYVADVAENKEPTYFKITAISNDGFTCENPEHDYPKKIVYQRNGQQLKVTISGGEKSSEFLFEKLTATPSL